MADKRRKFIVAVLKSRSGESDDIRFFDDRDVAMRYALDCTQQATRGVHITAISSELFDMLREEDAV